MDFQKEYEKGYDFYREKRFRDAREIFNKLYEQTGSFKALRMLINIDISQNSFRTAREMIETNMYYNNINTLRLLCRIDAQEYNHNNAIEYDKNIIEMTEFFNVSLYYNLVNSYIFNGNFAEVREVLRSIPLEKKTILSDFYYILMDIVFENYERALSRLEKIDKTVLPKGFSILYDKANAIINYNLGKAMADFEVLSRKGIDYKYLLYNNYDIYLQRFLNNHVMYINDLERFSILKYRKDMDILSLLEEVKEKIKKLNPRYYNFMSTYGVILDHPVGYNGDRPIYGLDVGVPIGSDRICRLRLVDYSDEFDIEGLSTDKSLRKRLNVK